jgi:hypothetical protein
MLMQAFAASASGNAEGLHADTQRKRRREIQGTGEFSTG